MFPSALGAHSWHPMAFNPQTKLVYLPTYKFMMAYGEDPNFKYQPGTWNTAVDPKLQTPPDDPAELRKGTASFEGRTIAWDPVAQKEVWSVKHASLQNGGILATASNLIFQGTGDGRFEARKVEDGALLWSFATHSGIIAGPVSYEQGGVQYVAVFAGYGGGFGLGEGGDTPIARPNGRVLVFKIGGKATLPVAQRAVAPLNPPTEKFSTQQVDTGRLLFTQHCYRCHGSGAQSVGVLPDLRRSAALSDPAVWRTILIDGALEPSGMVSFKRWLTPAQVEDIRAYVALKAQIAARQPPQ
jgi:mono/diheme cytochrome c family protein